MSTATAWRLVIGGWQPAALNDLIGNRFKSHRLKKADFKQIYTACLVYGVTPATGKRRVSLTIVLAKGQKARDPDSQWKSTLDGLQRAGAIKNDNRHWVELTPIKYERAVHRATIIDIEEL